MCIYCKNTAHILTLLSLCVFLLHKPNERQDWGWQPAPVSRLCMPTFSTYILPLCSVSYKNVTSHLLEKTFLLLAWGKQRHTEQIVDMKLSFVHFGVTVSRSSYWEVNGTFSRIFTTHAGLFYKCQSFTHICSANLLTVGFVYANQ